MVRVMLESEGAKKGVMAKQEEAHVTSMGGVCFTASPFHHLANRVACSNMSGYLHKRLLRWIHTTDQIIVLVCSRSVQNSIQPHHTFFHFWFCPLSSQDARQECLSQDNGSRRPNSKNGNDDDVFPKQHFRLENSISLQLRDMPKTISSVHEATAAVLVVKYSCPLFHVQYVTLQGRGRGRTTPLQKRKGK